MLKEKIIKDKDSDTFTVLPDDETQTLTKKMEKEAEKKRQE